MSSYPKSPSSMYPVFPMYKLRQHPISLPPPPKPQNSTDFATRVLFGYCPQARWGKNSFMELSMPMKTIEFEQNYNKQRQPNYHLRVLKHQLSVNAQVLHSCFFNKSLIVVAPQLQQGPVGTTAITSGFPIKQAFNAMVQMSPIFLIFAMLKRYTYTSLSLSHYFSLKGLFERTRY